MKILIGIQARSNSKRFPGKIFEKLGDKSLLQWIYSAARNTKELHQRKHQDEVHVKILGPAHDPELSTHCGSYQMELVQPACDENDLAQRYFEASKGYSHLVRLTADCPLHNPNVIHTAMVQLKNFDYVSNTIFRSYPEGLDVQCASVKAYEWIMEHSSDREHPFYEFDMNKKLRDQFEKEFKINHLMNPDFAFLFKGLSIDTKEDLELLRKAYVDPKLVRATA